VWNQDALPDFYSYPAIVADCYEDGLWALNFPDLSGCWCEGRTSDEVMRMGEVTLGEYMACREKSGMELPLPGDAAELEKTRLGSVIIVTVVMEKFRKKYNF
jgi:predicted RNase H-like HicB family nuclease